ncbi:MAG TPA: hypothetical protein VFA65_20995 [Bryobacteraceae bacterium]|nr:hypothetical protein [Bryobacteraceae bacterium]
MRITSIMFVALTVSLCGALQALAADVCSLSPRNVITNCGFETGDFTGWTVTGTDSAPSNNGIYYGVENFDQFSGNDAAYFGAINGEISLNQALAGLIPDDIYTLTFEAFNDTTPTGVYINNLSVSLGGQTIPLASQVAADGYTLYTAIVGSHTASSTLSLISRNDAGFWNIDSVQMIQTGTPEPSAFQLLGAGMLLLAAFYWKTRPKRA